MLICPSIYVERLFLVSTEIWKTNSLNLMEKVNVYLSRQANIQECWEHVVDYVANMRMICFVLGIFIFALFGS